MQCHRNLDVARLFLGHGTNDIFAARGRPRSRSLTDRQSQALSEREGVRTDPHASDVQHGRLADRWTVRAGSNTQRVNFNNALRGPAVSCNAAGVIGVCSVLETDVIQEWSRRQDGGVWLCDVTGDGTHGNSQAGRRVVSTVDSFIAGIGGS